MNSSVLYTLISLVPSPTPSFSSLLSTVKRGGPGTSSHVSDVEGRKGKKDRKRGRTWVSEQQEERRYQVTYHTYLASGGRLSYSPSVERVDG